MVELPFYIFVRLTLSVSTKFFQLKEMIYVSQKIPLCSGFTFFIEGSIQCFQIYSLRTYTNSIFEGRCHTHGRPE